MLIGSRRPSVVELRKKTAAVHRRRRELTVKSRRLVQSVVSSRQAITAEREVVKALVPFFVEQGRSMASRMEKVSAVPNSASVLVKRIFKPDEWRSELTNRLLPVLARKMAEAGVAHLMSYGVDVRRKKRKKGTKATTAAEWAEENEADWDSLVEAFKASDLPLGVMNEIPEWMQKSIAKRLTESFSQDYWDSVSETTMGDAERVLRQGLAEGWSIDDMAKQLRQHFTDPDETGFSRYARRRSENIARTESGYALNSARKDSVAELQRELGDKVPMKQSWLSVLGNTTRATHADLDGVPEDENSMWNLSGYEIPVPGHYSLPPEERCNCFPAGVLVSGDFVGVQQAWYEGRFAEIITRNGTILTLTANHPVVTAKGLVPACMIQPGDKVLSYKFKRNDSLSRPSTFTKQAAGQVAFGKGAIGFALDGGGRHVLEPDRVLLSGSYDVDYEPVPIEQIFQTLAMVSPVESRRAGPRDFYGDGLSLQGNIEIVRTDGILPECVEAVFCEEPEDRFLILADSSGRSLSELGRCSGCESGDRIDISSSGLPRISEPSLGRFRFIPGVSLSCSLAVGIASDFDASLSDSVRKDGPAVSGFFRESLERHAGFVSFDEVVEVGDFYSAGHVYDLQSRYGLIVAADPLYTDNRFPPSGIITANCQCSLTIEFGMDEADAQAEIEEYWARVEEREGE